MLTIQPWEVRPNSVAPLTALEAALANQSLCAVRYISPSGESWPNGHRDRAGHEVDMAVQLLMDSGSILELSWRMDGLNEGLEIRFGTGNEFRGDMSGNPTDVSGNPDWASFMGESIVDIRPTWHAPNDGCPEMPWAYRLGFSSGTPVVVALGEATASSFSYSPDDLIVLFDMHLARNYRIPSSATSSLGND